MQKHKYCKDKKFATIYEQSRHKNHLSHWPTVCVLHNLTKSVHNCTYLSGVCKACAVYISWPTICVPVCFYLYRRPLAHLPLNTSGPQPSRQWGIWPAGSLSPSLYSSATTTGWNTHTAMGTRLSLWPEINRNQHLRTSARIGEEATQPPCPVCFIASL